MKMSHPRSNKGNRLIVRVHQAIGAELVYDSRKYNFFDRIAKLMMANKTDIDLG